MPETPEELYEPAADALIMPPVEEWETFPFDGEMRPRRLQPPTALDSPRSRVGGIDCRTCLASDDDYLWVTEGWGLRGLNHPSGLPVVVLLEPRQHIAEPGDLTDEMASELAKDLLRACLHGADLVQSHHGAILSLRSPAPAAARVCDSCRTPPQARVTLSTE